MPAAGVSGGVSVPLLQQVGVSVTRHCRGNGVPPKNQLLGRTDVSEGSVAVSGAGPWVTVHVPGAGGGANVCVFLNRGVHSPANFKLDQPARRGSLGLGWGIRGDKGARNLRGPTSVGCLRDEHVSAGCSQQASRWTRGPMGWVGGLGTGHGRACICGGKWGVGMSRGEWGERGMGGAHALGGSFMPLCERNGPGDMRRMGTEGEGGRGVSARG